MDKHTLPVATTLPTEGFVRVPQILQVLPISRSGFWAKVKNGEFPAPVKLSPRVTAWPVGAVRAYLEAQGA